MQVTFHHFFPLVYTRAGVCACFPVTQFTPFRYMVGTIVLSLSIKLLLCSFLTVYGKIMKMVKCNVSIVCDGEVQGSFDLMITLIVRKWYRKHSICVNC